METVPYRSYVIRIWFRDGDDGAAVRVDVEEIQSGRQAELRDGLANDLATAIAATLAVAPSRPQPVGLPR